LGLLEVQTPHSHPIIGTPTDVPVPRKMNVRSFAMRGLYYRGARVVPRSATQLCQLNTPP